ncbi:MAG: sugar-binding protein [Lachnospiraceae bacterium]|nr:sugar-binding protein [Lachnospiraceae bacterium]
MKLQRLAKSFLGMTLAATMMAGCGTTGTGTSTGSTTTTTTTTTTTSTDAGSGTTETAPAPANGAKVGVSMPTKDLQRWNQDGANMESQLKAAGYEVDLQYAANDVQQQLSQIENMISNRCDVLVIAAIEGSSLGEALDMAKGANIPVIAYDRLIMNSDAVSYYATFDNYKVGTVQGTYVKDTLDLDNAAGPFNIEFTAGDPGDNNAGYFFNGAYDVLKDYIAEGKLVVVSGQKTFDEVATPTWATEVAQSRAENILSSFYADGTNIDVWLCSNDSTALGVENALAANYNGTYPIITGQDCDIQNTKNMIAGKQSMSVFKDTRTLASQVVKMVGQIINNETVDVNDEKTYDNGVKVVPSFLCEPVFADANNYQTILIDSGYYTEDQLK